MVNRDRTRKGPLLLCKIFVLLQTYESEDASKSTKLVRRVTKMAICLMPATEKGQNKSKWVTGSCTKWLTAERCRTRVSYSTLCQFQCCPRLSIVSVRHCAVPHCCVVNSEVVGVLRMENVSVGRGCFELRHGECSVSVNLPLTAGQTVQSCVHTQIRHPACTANWTHSGRPDTVNCYRGLALTYTSDIKCQCPFPASL